jgi:hypothetical protein
MPLHQPLQPSNLGLQCLRTAGVIDKRGIHGGALTGNYVVIGVLPAKHRFRCRRFQGWPFGIESQQCIAKRGESVSVASRKALPSVECGLCAHAGHRKTA